MKELVCVCVCLYVCVCLSTVQFVYSEKQSLLAQKHQTNKERKKKNSTKNTKRATFWFYFPFVLTFYIINGRFQIC